MTAKERVEAALDHRGPGPVPVDFGSTPVSGIHCSIVAALRRQYGLSPDPVRVHEPYQMLGWIDDDLKEAVGIDTDGIFSHKTLFGFPLQDWRPWTTPWGQEVLMPGGFVSSTQPDGSVLIYPQGDPDAPPSGQMPANGYFFDTIVRQEPLREDCLDPEDNLEEFGPFETDALEHFRAAADSLRESSRAVVACFGGTGFGDIALVPAPFLKRPRGIRDIQEWYISTVTRRDYIHAVFDKQCDYALQNLETVHALVGDAVDVLYVCGTDFGTQTSSFCSVDTLESLYIPYYKRVNDWVHRHTSWKTFKHSCGAVEPFIESFIGAGFDILNPVQCSAAGMDPGKLKSTYGDRICFWGGGVDTQKTLPYGTPAQVREEVLERCSIFSPGGGFVFNSIHNVQARTPLDNLVAMIEAVREFNRG